MERLDLARLSSLLGEGFFVHAFAQLDSTNSWLLEEAKNNAAEFSLAVAERQLAGRGREGRHFFSPHGGAYFSLLVHPKGAFDPALLTALSAVCVCEAAEELGAADCGIKWVNDVYQKNKKCCGILTQGVFEGARLAAAVIGIGANLTPPEGGFDPEIAPRAGAFFEKSLPYLRERFIAAVCQKIRKRLPLGTGAFLQDYQERSILPGRRVTVSSLVGGATFFATAEKIDDACRLVVRDDAGTLHTLSSGEVTLAL